MTDNLGTIEQIYGTSGNFLKTPDVKPGEVAEFEIVSVDVRAFADKQKLVAELKEGKAFVLNATNAKALAARFGTSEYAKWSGRTFRLIRTMTQYQGGTVECLRVV